MPCVGVLWVCGSVCGGLQVLDVMHHGYYDDGGGFVHMQDVKFMPMGRPINNVMCVPSSNAPRSAAKSALVLPSTSFCVAFPASMSSSVAWPLTFEQKIDSGFFARMAR